jgi:predicted acyl esterase
MKEEKDVRITVRDGVKIGVRIYRPDGGGPFPTLFAVSPYRYDNNELPASPQFLWRETGPIPWYIEQGYAYVHADVRGSGFSEGEFGFLDKKEQTDLYDVIEWIAGQPWSNGKVGAIGQSYYCMTQWFMGIQDPPHLACLGAYDGMNDVYRHMGYPGGIEGFFLAVWFAGSVRFSNLFPANGDHPRWVIPDLMESVHRHPFYDDWWKERCAVEHLDKIKVPLFAIGAWAKNDFHLPGIILGYQRARGPRKLFITGTATPFSAAADFSSIDLHKKHLLPFYDKYLKGLKTSYDERPNVEYEVHNTRAVRSFDSWPPPGARPMRFYLGKGPTGSVTSLNDGALGTSPPGADGGSTTYSYPQPSWTMGHVTFGREGPDPARAVLTFASQPLTADVEIAGHGKLVVYASSTRNDMDVIVKVSEQFQQAPEERAKGIQPRFQLVCRGWHRASHMDRDPRFNSDDIPYYTHEKSTPLTPGKVYKLEIALMPSAYRFKAGNRIRIDIACVDAQLTDPLTVHFYRPDKIGADTFYHDADHPSQLMLPVLSAD